MRRAANIVVMHIVIANSYDGYMNGIHCKEMNMVFIW